MGLTLEVTLDTDDGESEEVSLPGKYVVCSRCEGHGKHVNPNIDGNGITADEWNGPDWDDESREMYMSGGYDVRCEECAGERVVIVANLDLISDDLRKRYEKHLEEEAQYRAECAAERRYCERAGF